MGWIRFIRMFGDLEGEGSHYMTWILGLEKVLFSGFECRYSMGDQYPVYFVGQERFPFLIFVLSSP